MDFSSSSPTQSPATATPQPTTPQASPCHMDSGAVAWMLMSTVLVLSMFPGVAFFEAGLLRKKNTTSLFAQVLCGLTLLSVLWILVGFSLTFGGDVGGFIGDFRHAFFMDVHFDDCYHETVPIPTALFALFQLMFACITPMLMTGAYAERLAWKPFLIFSVVWEIVVYYPVAHWMWSPSGWLNKLGAQDFAGGIVLHTTAGASSLVACIILGHRHNYRKYHGEFPYSSLTTAAVGTTLLWTGWFGFNGGSAFGATSQAIAAVVNSQIGAVTSAAVFLSINAFKTGRPSVICMMNGAIGGLAGVTPATGYIAPQGALVLGALLGLTLEGGIQLLKHRWEIDDALDVSTVHGLTGIVGSLFIGFASSKAVNPKAADGLIYTHGRDWRLLGVQLCAVAVCGLWASFWTYVILRVIARKMPLRVHHKHEKAGLDAAIHGEVSEFMKPDKSGANDMAVANHSITTIGSEHGAQSTRASMGVGSTRNSRVHRRPEDQNVHRWFNTLNGPTSLADPLMASVASHVGTGTGTGSSGRALQDPLMASIASAAFAGAPRQVQDPMMASIASAALGGASHQPPTPPASGQGTPLNTSLQLIGNVQEYESDNEVSSQSEEGDPLRPSESALDLRVVRQRFAAAAAMHLQQQAEQQQTTQQQVREDIFAELAQPQATQPQAAPAATGNRRTRGAAYFSENPVEQGPSGMGSSLGSSGSGSMVPAVGNASPPPAAIASLLPGLAEVPEVPSTGVSDGESEESAPVRGLTRKETAQPGELQSSPTRGHESINS